MPENEQPVVLPLECGVKLAPYWTSVAVYAITLLLYVFITALWDSTLQQGIVNVVITDPIVVILGLFVVAGTLSLVFNAVMRRTIIITETTLTFTSRFHTRSFTHAEISKIVVGRERRMRIREKFAMLKVYIKGRRRPLRIRPGVYNNHTALFNALLHFGGDQSE